MLLISSALLLGFAVLAAVDGFYIHLVRLGLHRRPQSWGEHVWHTGRALLVPPLLLTIFSGAHLAIGIALLAIDQVIEILDVKAERASRADLGGVGRGELTLHVILIITRAAAIVFAFMAPPTAVASLLLPGGIVMAFVHVVLAWMYRPGLAVCCPRMA